MAAKTKASETEGPATLPAVRAVSVKMPAPKTTATPKTVRSQAVRSLRSFESGSSVSRMDCSTDLVRNRPPHRVPGVANTVSLLSSTGSPLISLMHTGHMSAHPWCECDDDQTGTD